MSSESKAASNNQNPCKCTTDKALKHKDFSHKDARGTQEHTFTDNRKVICIKHQLGNSGVARILRMPGHSMGTPRRVTQATPLSVLGCGLRD